MSYEKYSDSNESAGSDLKKFVWHQVLFAFATEAAVVVGYGLLVTGGDWVGFACSR